MSRRLAPALLLLSFVMPGAAQAQAPQLMMPSQAFTDAPQPGSPAGQSTWSDLPGGVSSRPYVKSFKVVNGPTTTDVFSGGIEAASSVASGSLTAVVSPVNLCGAGQAPAQGQCYATPNRVSLSFGYKTDQGLGLDFAAPSVPLSQTVNADTVFDVVIALNTLGKPLRWSWANGDLVSWKATGLGNDDSEIHLRIKPVDTQWINWSARGPVGCTATPIRDCAIDKADSRYLGASMVLSLDDSLDAGLTGAVFATQGAIAGFLVPENGPAGPTLDLQIAAAHSDSSGAAQKGVIKAFLPASALQSLYSVSPDQASTLFTATRRGDPGTQSAPTFSPVSESETDSAGLMIQIGDITFSAPTYRIAPKGGGGGKALKLKLARSGKFAMLTARANAACKKAACTFTIAKAAKAGKKPKTVLGAKSGKTGTLVLKVPRSKLAEGTYLVTVRKGKKTLGTETITV